MSKQLFTSESVSEGHPDKIADQISDAILDVAISQDKDARVACETFVTTGLVLVGGEITSKAIFDVQELVRKVIRDIGYKGMSCGFDADSCGIISTMHTQSPDIRMGVNKENAKHTLDSIGAGDQGMMFGYACKETPEYMPAAIMYSHQLAKRLADIRKKKNGLMPYLRPDAKTQVTIEYDDNKVLRIDSIVVSTQHDPEPKGVSKVKWQKKIKKEVEENVVKASVPLNLIDNRTRLLINPTGRFEIGGPHGDAGLTGRKIIVDTYGGSAPHGGGAFSGKDPSKVDRSAAYATRHIAKNIVASGLAEKCTIQVSYAIGISKPVGYHVNTYGTAISGISDQHLEKVIAKLFDLRPAAIINDLGLLDGKTWVYRDTAAYGHFGRSKFPWEKLNRVKDIKRSV